jgi:hypothetical protein
VIARAGESVGQESDGGAVFIVRLGKILRLEGDPPAGERGLSLEDGILAARDLALRDIPHILRAGGPDRKGQQGKKKEQSGAVR